MATVLYLVLLAADHGGRRLAGEALPHRRSEVSACSDIFDILRDNWLLLLIGQYPNGPLGGIAATLILSVLGIVLAFPLSACCWRWRGCRPGALLRWPATALVYVVRGVPLLMVILWVYFLVPLLIGRDVSGFTTMLCTLVIYEGAYLSRGGARRHPGAAEGADGGGARARPQPPRARCGYVILPQALYNMLPSMLSQFISTIKETTLGYVINVHGADLRGEPDQQPAADQAVPGVLHPGDHLLRRLLEPDAAGAMAGAAHRPQAARRRAGARERAAAAAGRPSHA